MESFNRRQWLRSTAAGGLALSAASLGAAPKKRRPRVGVVFTEFTYRSHAHVIMENFFEPYLFNGRPTDPGVEVVSFYGDQFPSRDMSRDVAKKYNVPIFKTIGEALCVGGDKLAVDAALLIGEHGNYPVNELGQRMYPRKRFFDQALAVMERSNRFVPIFNDKHLSYRWDWAKEMYDTARKHGAPFMAGSSVPLAHRRPDLTLPKNARIEEAVSVHGGPMESYDFHGLEVLQSMVESRRGGETGVSKIEFLEGEQAWAAAEQGRWSKQLALQAMGAEVGGSPKDLRALTGDTPFHATLVHYKDGLRAAVLKVGRSSTRWNFACRLKGDTQPRATSFYTGPWNNRNLFKALSHAIQTHFIRGRAPYAVERTLLVTGMLEAAMRARRQDSRALKTPHLEFAYKPVDFREMREMGGTWKIITPDIPEPKTFGPGPTK